MRKSPLLNLHRAYESSLGVILSKWLFRLILLLTMMAGVCKFSTLPIKLMSVECMVVLGAYVTLLLLTHHVYRATDIGMASVTELVMSQMLSNLISIGVVYVGVALYVHHMFNILPLVIVGLVQMVIGIVWSLVTNSYYYKRRRKPRTVIIYKYKSQLDLLYESPNFHDKYDVCKLIENPAEDFDALRKEVEGCEVLFSVGSHAEITNGLAKLCVEMGIIGYFMPRLGHIVMTGAEYMSRFSLPVMRVRRAGGHSEYRFFKRAFDMFAASVGIVVASPIMLATAIAIWMEDHGPVFYRQVRLTKNGREFKILKFRSMTVNAEQDGVARLAGQNDSRITKVGHFIRACRIDELPQLFNILLGDMSIVGPRPERPEIAQQYQETLPEFALRLQVKAGLTGLAQVYGRYNTEPYYKLQMDLMYINDMSFLKDLQLILATIKILFVKDSTQGIAQGQETALADPTRKSA
jgi:exopolysaccharide biosynthesis polyprenyl glycosylphosphotransferase